MCAEGENPKGMDCANKWEEENRGREGITCRERPHQSESNKIKQRGSGSDLWSHRKRILEIKKHWVVYAIPPSAQNTKKEVNEKTRKKVKGEIDKKTNHLQEIK